MVDVDLLVESDGLYMTSLEDGQSFVWRLLTLKEYHVFSSLRQQSIWHPYQIYNEVFNRCFVGEPLALSGDTPAGIFLAMGELIMYLSGDCAGQEREEIDAARSMYNNGSVLEVMKRVILMAFPYRPEEIDHWTRPKLVRNFVLAEALLQNKSDYAPIDTSKIMTQEELAKQKNKPVVDFRKENREISGEFGDRQHALDLHPADMAKKAKRTKKLSADQARRLDQSKQEESKQRKVHRRS